MLQDDERFTPADQLPAGLYERAKALADAALTVEGYTVPWVAGRSLDGTEFYPDSDLPLEVTDAKVKTRRSVALHEFAELIRMNEGITYDKDSDPPGTAHYDANGVEKIDVEMQGGTWEPYCMAFRPIIKEVDDEALTNLPPANKWDRRPYEDDDPVLLAEIDAADKSTFAAPGSATSGLQAYDLEGAGRRRRKRRKKPIPPVIQIIEESKMDDLKLFIPITKIDVAKRLVYGVVTAEKPDVVGEICDYATTKPLYQKWSADFAKATDGKSLGNLRSMHGHIAAGKVVELAFNDEAKQIEVCGKVVDDGEWTKVEEGVYTGFSQGGRYIKRWPDPDQPSLMRYTADPVEVSLVDNPCLPEATFQFVKADGSTEVRKFKPVDAMPALVPAMSRSEMIEYAAKWKEGDKVPDTFWQGYLLMRSATGGDALIEICKAGTPNAPVAGEMAKIAALAKREDDPWRKVTFWESDRLAGQRFTEKGDLAAAIVKLDAEEAAKATAAPVLDVLANIKNSLAKHGGGGDAAAAQAGKTATAAGDGAVVAKKDFTDDERKKLASEGKAMKDGSLRIENKSDLENAISAYGRAKNKAAAKRHIIKRAKALGATDLLPADWPGSTKDKGSKKIAGDGGVVKNLFFVQGLVGLLASLEQWEEDYEMITRWGAADAERNELCTRFGSVLTDFADLVADILDRAITGITAEEQGEAEGAIQRATIMFDLQKLAGERLLAKVGAKHAKADKDRIKQAHDLLVDLDPDCCDAAGDGDAEKLAKQLEAEREANAKVLSDVIMPAIKELADQLGKVNSTVQTIADQPLPMGTTSVRVMEKTADFGSLADQLGATKIGDDLERLAAAALRKAQTMTIAPPAR